MSDEYEELRVRAEHVLRSIRTSPQESRRPFFVEFAGTPKSGKSTCIDALAHFFRRLGYRVLSPVEGASRRTPFYLKNDLTAFNTWSACYALSHILEALHHADRYEIAILDRGLFDSLVWFDLLAQRDEIDDADRRAVQEFLLVEKWRGVIDLVALFVADPTTALARENSGKLIYKHGRAMNPEFLAELNISYSRVAEEWSDRFSQFLWIDTSGEKDTRRQATAMVADTVLSLIEARED